MFETCDWNDEGDAALGDQVTSERERIAGARRTETTSRKNRLKRNRQLLDVLRSLNTPSTLHPDLPPPPEATPPKRRKKTHTTDVTPSDTSPPEDAPAVERPLESAERLSRRQWRNKLKNKKRNRNKFKAGAGHKGAGAGHKGAGAGHKGAGATAALEETPQNLRNGNVKETPTPPGPHDRSSQHVTPRERARLQKLKKMMKSQAGRKKTETPREEEDPHNTEQLEAESSAGGRDRSAALRSRMEERLNSARFRYINQQLYTSSSQEARHLFLQDPQAFSLYHSGFSQQVQRWPINPITEIIKYIKNRPSSLVVADFGCGDALLARSVRNKVHSFDLVALNDHVTVCDIAEVPLQDVSVDVAVFCLSLMGTNLSDFLQEAHRVLKSGGVLLVAEVSSRFDDVRQFLSAMSQLGFKTVNKNTENSHFFLFEFSKSGRARDVTNHPGLQLKPCLYKKR